MRDHRSVDDAGLGAGRAESNGSTPAPSASPWRADGDDRPRRRPADDPARVVILDTDRSSAPGRHAGFTVVGRAADVDAALRRVVGTTTRPARVNGNGHRDPLELLRRLERIDPTSRPLLVAPFEADDAPATDDPADVDPVEAALRRLTPQERRVLDLVAEGLPNRAIAERLDLAEKTVRNYVSSVLAKLRMQNRTQVAAYIARRNARRGRRHGMAL